MQVEAGGLLHNLSSPFTMHLYRTLAGFFVTSGSQIEPPGTRR